jgi:predicted MPP superfamily phosphohydrolase
LAIFSTTRRKFLGLAVAAGATALAADTVLVEPNHPVLVRREIALNRWPEALDGFTIALLSDFHYDPLFSSHPLHAAIPVVNDLHPDIILLTGDFVSVPLVPGNDKAGAASAEPCSALLHQMHAPYGLWACLGNHDYYTDPGRVTSALRSQGIHVLINQSSPIESKGARFWVSGVNDILGDEADLDATLHDVPANEATILLVHEPDFADDVVKKRAIDLQLSGHTHGGQVRLPFLPPLYLPDLGKKYVAGLYRIGPLTLYTNRGLGTFALPVRWNCPPEITLITLRRGIGL